MRRALLSLTVTTLLGLAGVVGAQAQQTDPSQVLLGSGTSAASVATRGYDVSASGITLPADSTFTSFSSVTYRVTALDGTMPRSFGVTLLPDDGSVGAQHIGSSTLRFDDARAAYPDGYCVTWVEVSMFDEKFGESAEDPECTVYPGVRVVSGVSGGVDGIGGEVATEDGEARTGLSASGPAPIAGLISVLVIAAAAVLMVRYGSLRD